MKAVYAIRNTTNGKLYIGSSVDVRLRFKNHRYDLRKGRHHCAHLQNAWNKYGEGSFVFEVVERVGPDDDLLGAEERWLREHYGKPHCYNIGARAHAAWLGRKHTAASRAKMSEAQKGNRHRLGQTSSSEHRQRISSAMKGKKKSPEHAEKISRRMMGNSCAKGRVVTEGERAARGRAVAETTQGLEFISVAAAAAHYGMVRANLIRTLRGDGVVKRGSCKGLHFRYRHILPEPRE